MRKRPNRRLRLHTWGMGMMLILCLIAWTATPGPPQPVPPSSNPQASTEPGGERIVPAAKDIRESTGIWVFLGWIWLSILGIVYFLRLKIREADRLFRMKFFSSPKK